MRELAHSDSPSITVPATAARRQNEKGIAMPEFAQFIAFTGTINPLTLPNPSDGSFHVFEFDLPNLDTDRTALLMLKLSSFKETAAGSATLGLKAEGPNVNVEFTFLLDHPAYAQPRSWHEIIRKNIFASSGNRLLVQGPPEGSGNKVTVSDMVILYHAKTGTVVGPHPT